MSQFQPPPTWALPVIKNETTGEPVFNPIWLRWFLDLSAQLNASGVSSITDHSVTYVKIQQVSSGYLLGRATAGTGTVEEIALGTNLSFTGTTLNAAGGSGTPGGADTNIQYKDGTAFGGDANFTWDKTNKKFYVNSAGPHGFGYTDSSSSFALGGTFAGGATYTYGLVTYQTLTPAVGGTAVGMGNYTNLTKAASGTHPLFLGTDLSAPSIGGGGATVTTAATLRVDSAPTGGATNYALWVTGDAKKSRIETTIELGTETTFPAAIIRTPDAISADTNAPNLAIFGGAGLGTGTGGTAYLGGGVAGATGTGGNVILEGGPGGATSGDGGAINITSGAGAGSGNSGGGINITGGDAGTGNADGGMLFVKPGAGVGSGAGGLLFFVGATPGATGIGGGIAAQAGDGGVTSGAGGAISIGAGNATTSGAGGALFMNAGQGIGAVGGQVGLTGGSSNHSSGAGHTFIQGGNNSGSGVGGDVRLSGGTSTSGTPGHVVLNGTGGALATNATGGFTCIPTCAGTPTGVPANVPTGNVALVYDTANNKLYVYDGGWISTTLA